MRPVLTFALLIASTALASAVDISVKPKGVGGKDLPSLTVHILEPIAGFKVNLTRSDGKKLEVKGGGQPGVNRTIELVQPEGRFSYKGVLSINLPTQSEPETMPLEFETEVFG